MKRLTTTDFIEKSKKIHGDKYDYSQSNYINSNTKISIICQIHGLFYQKPRDHMNGSNCKFCVDNNIKYTNEVFIKKGKKIHYDKYDYSLVEYIDCNTKIKIICPIHGIFEQRPSSHLRGDGCSKCSNNFSSKDEFIIKSTNIHNNKYNYSLVEYINNKTKVKIICPIHGIFEQRPDNHLGLKQNCPKCGNNSVSLKNGSDKDTFINKSIIIHGKKYNYDQVNYKNNITKIKIVCEKHGIFEQTPNHHLRGQGCPICSESKGEKIIRTFLLKNNIIFITQKIFEDCKFKNFLPFDFYLPEINSCIEFDGEQHFKPINFFGGLKSFEELKIKDKIKNNYCQKNNIKLIRLKNIKTLNNVLKNKLKL